MAGWFGFSPRTTIWVSRFIPRSVLLRPERPPRRGWVLVALRNAFFRLLHAPSLEEGVIETVHGGGDTDTNAAIAGALLGAVHGRAAVPSRWTRMILECRPAAGPGVVHPRPPEYWPADALAIAERLVSFA